jgi:signal transduction histidine kinase
MEPAGQSALRSDELAFAAPPANPVEPRVLRSTYDVVDRGLVTLALVWQVLWFVGDDRLWPIRQESAVAAVLIWVCGVTWAALAAAQAFDVGRWRWAIRAANVVALEAASIAVLTAASQSNPHDWGAATSLAVLPGALAGLLFPFWIAFAGITFCVLVEAGIILETLTSGTLGPSTVVLFPAYALSLSIATIAARRALVRDAREVDSASADLIEAELDRIVVEGVEAAVRREERLIHATVLNTLTAILRGGIGSPELRDRLRDRCREAADVMRQVVQRANPAPSGRSPGHWLDRDLNDSIVDLFAAGVVVKADCASLIDVPPDVYDAIVTAAREALSNVLRHADARSVWITSDRKVDQRGQRVTVEIRDDGRGFSEGDADGRFGVRGAVVQSLVDVGGTSRVTSRPGEGTSVRIKWASSASGGRIPVFRPAARAFAFPILISFGAFTALAILLTRDEIVNPRGTLLALSILVALGVLVAWWARSGALPWWVVLVVAGLSPLVYQLEGASLADPHGPWADWSSRAIVALFLVTVAAGPGWSWLVLIPTWLFIQGDILHEVLAAGTALIIAAALFGRSTRRNAAAVSAARSQAAEEKAAAAVSKARVGRMSSRYGSLRESNVTGMLDGIADGRIDPDHPHVRYQAGLEERFIRTVVKVDPTVDAVHALATSLAVRALHRGVFLDVDIYDRAPGGATETAVGRDSLLRAIDCSKPGEAARFSARHEGGTYAIRLITPIDEDSRPDMLRLPVPGVTVDPAEPEMLWELRIDDGGRP